MNSANWVKPILDRLPATTITVFGDFCLDAYWVLNDDAPELSIETGLPLRRVAQQHYSLGGAGSVVANLSAMGVGSIRAIGAVGADLFGAELGSMLRESAVNTTGLLIEDCLQTMVYAKPFSGDTEHSRIDFGAFNIYPDLLIDRLLAELESAFQTSHAVILNQQVPTSISSPATIRRINSIVAAHPQTLCVADARHYSDCYAGSVMKLNMHEAARILGEPDTPEYTQEQVRQYVTRIRAHSGRPAFVTCGERGLTVADMDGIPFEVPGLHISEPTDPVGAGDAVVAGLAAAMAAGATVRQAAEFANFAASITVRQLKGTGTASAEQILGVADGHYRHGVRT